MIDEYLKSCNHAPSTAAMSASGQAAKLNDAEVLYLFVVACASHGGNCQQAQRSQKRCGNVKAKLSRSQFNRRLWALEHRLLELLGLLSTLAKAENQEFALDSFPWPVCKNIRIQRCQLVRGAAFRGYNASKREYFYGDKVHLITARDGRVVEFDFTPGSRSDAVAFKLLGFDLPPGSRVLADKAYNVYPAEDQLRNDGEVDLQPIRKRNCKKPDNTYCTNWVRKHERRHIETDISQLLARVPKRLHAVTTKGFMLKMMGFILAHNLLWLF
jgi:hypothetical protein